MNNSSLTYAIFPIITIYYPHFLHLLYQYYIKNFPKSKAPIPWLKTLKNFVIINYKNKERKEQEYMKTKAGIALWLLAHFALNIPLFAISSFIYERR
jgi:hypothetical protein